MRIHRGIAIALVIGVVVALSTVVVRSAGAISQGTPTLATIRFAQHLTIEDAVAFARSKGQLVELLHAYDAGTVAWTGGYFVSATASPREIADAYRREHLATTQDLAAHYASAGTELAKRGDIIQLLASLTLAQHVFEATPSIFGALVRVDNSGLASLRSDGRVAMVTLRDAAPSKPAGGALAARMQSHIARDNWVPSAIYVTVQPSSLGGRYVSHDITWYSGRTLGFGQYDGMEADFLLSGNNGTYLTRAESCCGTRIPQVTSWSTTFPSNWRGDPPYLDTRVGDSPDEWAYTIGTPGGQQLGTGVWYNTYIRAANGDADTDYGRISPQLSTCGFPNPPCDTWSMAADDTCYSTWGIAIPVVNWFWDRYAGPWSCV